MRTGSLRFHGGKTTSVWSGSETMGIRIKIEVSDEHDDEVFSTEFVIGNTNIVLVGMVMEKATKQVQDAIAYYLIDKNGEEQ